VTSVGGGGGSLGGTLGGGGGSLGGLSRVRITNPYDSLPGIARALARSVVPGEAFIMTSAPLGQIRRINILQENKHVCVCFLRFTSNA